MGAFPRAVFSEPELNITRWFAEKCGVNDIPTVRQIKMRRKDILKLAGGNPAEMDGKLGNIYTLLDLKEILAHVHMTLSLKMLIVMLSTRNGRIP